VAPGADGSESEREFFDGGMRHGQVEHMGSFAASAC
jgi:hypothetical protein